MLSCLLFEITWLLLRLYLLLQKPLPTYFLNSQSSFKDRDNLPVHRVFRRVEYSNKHGSFQNSISLWNLGLIVFKNFNER
ncbi:hypothetical protein B0T13DRAFT_474458 [Neurospora crassa]|nr:hypothetical protein B0T13DRAFT_474458 [Neurospora crassa]